jgi:RNA polymerase subunit RPABC4/transcription elongation factor Spt4
MDQKQRCKDLTIKENETCPEKESTKSEVSEKEKIRNSQM